MYTFKPQAKQNAKRFLVKTCKIDELDIAEYLTQNGDAQWGCYLDDSGKPAKFNDVISAIEARAAETCKPADEQPVASAAQEPEVPAEAEQQMQALSAEIDLVLSTNEQITEAEVPYEAAAAADSAAAAFGAFAFAQLTAEPAQETSAQSTRVPTGRKIEKDRAKQNGVTRPSAGTTCAQVWMLADHMTKFTGTCARLSSVIDAAKELGINQYTARTQYACWRKFNGITGRVTK